MEIRKKSLKFNYLLSLILNLSGYIFPLITFPYVSRVLGASGLGKVSFAETFASYFILLTNLGIPTYGIRACAAVRDNKKELAKVTKELFSISLIMMCISFSFFVYLILFLPQFANRRELLFINCISIILTPFSVNWFFNAIEDFSYITVRTILVKFFTLIFTFIFVRNANDYNLYALVLVLSTAGSYIFNYIYMTKIIDLKNVSRLNLKKHIKPIIVLFATTAAATVYSSVDVTMLGLWVGDEQVGIYNVAHKLRQVILMFVSTVGTVVIPRLSYFVMNKKVDEFKGLIVKTIDFISSVSFSLVLFFILVSNESIFIIAGRDYVNSIIVFLCILPTIVFCSFSNLTGLQILVPMEKENILLKSLVLGAIVDVALNLVLIYKFEAVGVAVSTSIAEACVLIYQVNYLKQHHLVFFKGLKLVKRLAYNLFPFCITLVFGLFFAIDNILLSFVIKAIIYWGCYVLILFIFKDPFFITNFVPLFTNLKSKL